jgi:hypothetical protein
MTAIDCTYEEFLETWTPSRHLMQACLPSNLGDPVAEHRLMQDFEAIGDVPRVLKQPGTYNSMDDGEAQIRRLEYLKDHQADWSADFYERMINKGVRADRLITFIECIARDWVQSYSIRQKSASMLAIKASIQAHDRRMHKSTAGKYVLDNGDFKVDPLFDESETSMLFQVNQEILSYAIPDYIQAVYGEWSGSTDDLYVRRGICMSHKPKADRMEASYLSSFSLSIGSTELFAQTMGGRVCTKIPCIVSCPIMALHDRVVAFAPFINGMTLDQMEVIVAPPVEATPLVYHGVYGDISEYSFR